MNIPDLKIPRIVVIGGGFAGLKFVKKLNTTNYQVVLLDKNNYHTFQPLMYQVATAGLEPDSVVYPLRKIIKGKKHTHFRIAEVEKIDRATKKVFTDIGKLTYDFLIVATGAGNNFFGLENLQKLSYPMKNLRESLDLRTVILENFEEALNLNDPIKIESKLNFVIVGGGATGVELAGALAELKTHVFQKDYPDLDVSKMQIHLIEAAPRLLSAMSERASEKSQKFLERLGVKIWLDTFVQDFDGKLVTTNKQNFNTETVIWAAGVQANKLEGLTLETGAMGRYYTNDFNRSLEDDNIYIIGDAAIIKDDKLPKGHAMLASVASQQGKHLAKNFNRIAKRKEMSPFKYKDKGTMATVGRNLAVVDLPFMSFSGILAWFTWMFVHLMLLVDFRNRLIVFTNWAWSYIKFDKGTRLIIKRSKKK